VTADQTTGWLERHLATHCYTDGCYYLLLHEMFPSAYRVTQKVWSLWEVAYVVYV